VPITSGSSETITPVPIPDRPLEVLTLNQEPDGAAARSEGGRFTPYLKVWETITNSKEVIKGNKIYSSDSDNVASTSSPIPSPSIDKSKQDSVNMIKWESDSISGHQSSLHMQITPANASTIHLSKSYSRQTNWWSLMPRVYRDRIKTIGVTGSTTKRDNVHLGSNSSDRIS
jgi:hypothetical protein